MITVSVSEDGTPLVWSAQGKHHTIFSLSITMSIKINFVGLHAI